MRFRKCTFLQPTNQTATPKPKTLYERIIDILSINVIKHNLWRLSPHEILCRLSPIIAEFTMAELDRIIKCARSKSECEVNINATFQQK